LVVLAALAFISCHKSLPPEETNSFHPYSIRHAIIHQECFGDTRGTEDMFIDSFGRVEGHDIHSEHITENGIQPLINYSIKHEANMIIVDSIRQQAVQIKDPMIDSVFHLPESEVPPPEEEFQNYFGGRGFRKVGTAVMAGITVNTWQHADRPVFLYEWHGIMVARKAGTADLGNELRLISIDTVTPIDPARFEVPGGYPIKDMTAPPPGGRRPQQTPDDRSSPDNSPGDQSPGQSPGGSPRF
jgi:hypothetical protein